MTFPNQEYSIFNQLENAYISFMQKNAEVLILLVLRESFKLLMNQLQNDYE